MRTAAAWAWLLAAAAAAEGQDQQLGARTKAMGGSYTAFEDDPVSVWLNPAGIATQPDQMAVVYQTYVTYPLHREQTAGSVTVETSAEPETTFVDPALLPSYLGFVFQLGDDTAVGLCYARPYHLNYSFDQVADAFDAGMNPDSNLDQSFSRFRVAFAHDFRLREAGVPGFLNHIAVGLGLDVGYERWQFKSATEDATDSATAYGAGLGLLVGLFDDTESFRANLGVAYQSAMKWDFNIDPDLAPAFDMPNQVNVGVTFYLLQGTPLRVTVDLQWIEWSETADPPRFANHPEFKDAVNTSLGLEYRVKLNDRLSLYPRAGVRRVDAPWEDEDDLPMTSNYKLVLDTNGETFTLLTLGAGLSWKNAAGRVHSLDLAGDVGGDSYTTAIGFTMEF